MIFIAHIFRRGFCSVGPLCSYGILVFTALGTSRMAERLGDGRRRGRSNFAHGEITSAPQTKVVRNVNRFERMYINKKKKKCGRKIGVYHSIRETWTFGWSLGILLESTEARSCVLVPREKDQRIPSCTLFAKIASQLSPNWFLVRALAILLEVLAITCSNFLVILARMYQPESPLSRTPRPESFS